MKLYLAGIEHGVMTYIENFEIKKNYLFLGSFYYFQSQYIKYINNDIFLLDSGAFTFMKQSSRTNVDWDKYLKKYINFINKYNIKLFFELDIDSVVGLEKVRKMRKKLEKETGKKSIPVWHKNRGKENYIKLVKNYDYIAYGGFLTDGISTQKNLKYLPWFINKARQNNCKVHLLGYTGKDLEKTNAYSADSTSWTLGNRFGLLYKFNGKKMKKIDKPPNTKFNQKRIANHNFREWLKYQQYLLKSSSQNPANKK